MSGNPRSVSQTKEASLKSYEVRLKADIKSMVDNFVEILKLAKVSSLCDISRAKAYVTV